jgi:hypothetical protein
MSFKKHDYSYRASKDFNPGNSVFITIPLGGRLRTSKIIIDGSVNVTGGAANGVAIDENPSGFISRIIVHAVKQDGSYYPDGEIKNVFTRSLHRRRMFDSEHGKVVADLVTPAGVSGAIALTNLHYEYVCNFALPGLKRPIDTGLPTEQYKSITFEVVCGNRDTLFTGNDRVFDFTNLKIRYVDRREQMDGDAFVLLENDLYVPINGANPELSIENLPVGWNFLDCTVTALSNKQYSDAIVNKVRVRRGNDTWIERTRLELVGMLYDDDGPNSIDPSQSSTGLYFLPMNGADGLLYSAVAVGTYQDMNPIFDVNNPGGAGNDALIFNLRRVAFPENFIPKKPTAMAAKTAGSVVNQG